MSYYIILIFTACLKVAAINCILQMKKLSLRKVNSFEGSQLVRTDYGFKKSGFLTIKAHAFFFTTKNWLLCNNINANYYNKHPQKFLNIIIVNFFFCFIRTKLQFLTPCTSSLPTEKPVFEFEYKYFYIV